MIPAQRGHQKDQNERQRRQLQSRDDQALRYSDNAVDNHPRSLKQRDTAREPIALIAIFYILRRDLRVFQVSILDQEQELAIIDREWVCDPGAVEDEAAHIRVKTVRHGPAIVSELVKRLPW